VALSWWNPIAWWAARRLERAEEDCCDAAVLRFQPDESQGYGQTLLAVTEFLATGKLPAPALSIGVVRTNHLKRRLTMILNGPRWPTLSKTRLAIFCLAGALMITVTWRAVTGHNDAQSARAALERRIEQTSPKHSGAPQIELAEQPDARLSAMLKLEALKPEPGDDELQKLLKERYNAALSAFQGYQLQLQYELKANIVASVCTATRDLFEAELALVSSASDKTRILERYVEVSKSTWKQVDAKTKQGLEGGSSANEGLAHAAALEAEIKLLRFRAAERSTASDEIPVPERTAGRAVRLQRPVEPGAAPPPIQDSELVSILPGDDERRKLLKERCNAAIRSLHDATHNFSWRKVRVADVLVPAKNVLHAKLELSDNPEDQIRAREDYLAVTKFLENRARRRLDAGGTNSFDRIDESEAREARFEAEIEVLNFRKEPRNTPVEMPPKAEPAPAGSRAPEQVPGPMGPTELAPINVYPAKPVSVPIFLNLRYPERIDPAPGDDEMRKLLKEKYNAAARAMQVYQQQFQSGNLDLAARIEDILAAGRNLLDAQLALAEKSEDELHALEPYLAFTRYLEQVADGWVKAGGVVGVDAPLEAARMREARADAELRLLKLRRTFAQKHGLEPRPNVPTETAAPGRPIETASEAPHENPFSATKHPIGASTLLAFMDPMRRIESGPADDEKQKLLKEKYIAAARAMQVYHEQWQSGNFDLVKQIDDLSATARNLRDAELALEQRQQLQLGVLETYLDFTRYLEQAADGWVKAGGIAGTYAPLTAARMHEARVDAELKARNLRHELAQHELRNPPAILKREPTSSVRPRLLTSKPVDTAPNDDERTKLVKQRYNAALRSLTAIHNRRQVDASISLSEVIAAARQVLSADVAVHKPEDIVPAYERYSELMKFVEDQAEAQWKTRTISRNELEAAHEARLDAEIQLLDAKRAARWPLPEKAG
jgi:hypothetical protein